MGVYLKFLFNATHVTDVTTDWYSCPRWFECFCATISKGVAWKSWQQVKSRVSTASSASEETSFSLVKFWAAALRRPRSVVRFVYRSRVTASSASEETSFFSLMNMGCGHPQTWERSAFHVSQSCHKHPIAQLLACRGGNRVIGNTSAPRRRFRLAVSIQCSTD